MAGGAAAAPAAASDGHGDEGACAERGGEADEVDKELAEYMALFQDVPDEI